MGGGSKKQTVGYKYYLGMHMILCHGPIDKLQWIEVGEKLAWQGSFANGQININKPNLFGGESSEGGVSGAVDIENGGPTQGTNSYLSRLGSLLPAYRGVVGVVLRQCYIGLNPYLKKWAFRAQRIHVRQNGLPQWYDSKSMIGVGEAGADSLAITELADTSGGWKYLNVPVESSADYSSVGFDDSAWAVGQMPFASLNNHIYTPLSGFPAYYNTFWPLDTTMWLRKVIKFDRVVPIKMQILIDNYATIWVNGHRILGPDAGWSGIPDLEKNFFEFVVPVEYLIVGNNTFVIKARDPGGVFNYIATRAIAHWDMNPAHIIRECLTDPTWGMGYPEEDIDDTSFMAAADTLFSEGMGMSLLWSSQTAIEDFVDEVISHISATLYVSRTTGKFVLKLIRKDYVEADLLELDDSSIEKVDNAARPAFGELVNSLTVNYWDYSTGETASLTVQDQALIQMQGSVINTTVQYPGFSNSVIASKVCLRDLKSLSVPLLQCTIQTNRKGALLNIGDVFKLTWPLLDINHLTMRVTGMSLGDGRSNKVKITCIEDIFSFPDSITNSPPVASWEDPSQPPLPAEYRIAVEAPYYEIVQRLGQTDADSTFSAHPDAGYLLASAARPGLAVNARLWVDSGAGYEDTVSLDFSPYGLLASKVSFNDTLFSFSEIGDFDQIKIGTHAQIGQELVRIDSIDIALMQATVGRAVLDTVPAEHGVGSVFMAWDVYADSDQTEYVTGESIDVKITPASGSGVVSLLEAYADTVVMAKRAIRPYPPGKLLIVGAPYPANILGSALLSVSWAHRDRLLQTTGELQDTTVGNIGPEAGTTYTLRIYGENDSLVRTEDLIAGTSFTYLLDDEKSDSGLFTSSEYVPSYATLSAMGAVLGTGTYKWTNGVAGNNGKIYCAPYSSNKILIIDPVAGTATLSNMGATIVAETHLWSGASLGGNGKIYGMPIEGSDILIIDTTAGTATRSTMGATLTGATKWHGSVAGNNGKIYGVPFNSTDVLIIDPAANTATRSAMGATLTGSSKWFGGALGVNGKIYCVPFDATDILIIDPATGTATRSAMGATLTGSAKWLGAVSGADGKIYCAPFNATDILIIDPVAGTATRSAMGATLTDGAKWSGASLGNDNKIYCVPYSAIDMLIIDTSAGTATRSTMGASITGNTNWQGCVKGSNGKIYGVPINSEKIIIISPEEAAGTDPRINGRLRIELESERDTILSLQKHDYTILREGYGFNYGEFYGGT